MRLVKLLFFKLFVFILTIITLAFSSCNDDDTSVTVKGFYNGECSKYNYVLNEDESACECPEGTHYRLPKVLGNNDEFTLCREINEGSFLYKADIASCLYEVRDTSLAVDGYENVYDAIGLADFDFENNNLLLWLGTGANGERSTLSIFGGSAVGGEQSVMTFHEDGSFSVVYHGLGNWEGDCLDWKERSPNCGEAYFVTTTGRSNPERTKINLELRWTNCRDELLDIGTIEMWKDWN